MAVFNLKLTPAVKKGVRASLIFLFTIGVIVLLSRIPLFSGITHAIQASFTKTGTGINAAFGRLTKSEDELIVERDTFRELAADLAIDNARMHQLEEDVREMQALLSYTQSSPYSAITARVIARSEEGNHTMLIDKGEVDGVREKLAVIVENGHMIGFVQTVKRNSSTVLLLRHEESKIPAMIIGTDETVGLVEGQEGFLLRMGFIPQRIEIEQADVVVTSGLDGIFPKGLVIGAIDSVEKNASSTFQEAFVQPFYDADSYTNVLILDPFQEDL